MRKPMLAGNWKMFKTAAEADAFADDFVNAVGDVADRDILICPPFLYVDRLAKAFAGSKVNVGAENLFWEDEGAFTGEVSAPMIRSVGASHVIIGHSERRQYFGETDETVNKRTKAALKHGLTPVVCVGETLDEREASRTFEVIEAQVRGGLKDINAAGEILIAYEPVWAIGTGKTATPEMAQEVHALIRTILKEMFGDGGDLIRILYGGSVKPDNVDDLMAQADIDGALVGGASLDVKSFERIVKFEG